MEETFRLLSEHILSRLDRGDISLRCGGGQCVKGGTHVVTCSQETDAIKVGKVRSGSLCWSAELQQKRNSCCF